MNAISLALKFLVIICVGCLTAVFAEARDSVISYVDNGFWVIENTSNVARTYRFEVKSNSGLTVNQGTSAINAGEKNRTNYSGDYRYNVFESAETSLGPQNNRQPQPNNNTLKERIAELERDLSESNRSIGQLKKDLSQASGANELQVKNAADAAKRYQEQIKTLSEKVSEEGMKVVKIEEAFAQQMGRAETARSKMENDIARLKQELMVWIDRERGTRTFQLTDEEIQREKSRSHLRLNISFDALGGQSGYSIINISGRSVRFDLISSLKENALSGPTDLFSRIYLPNNCRYYTGIKYYDPKLEIVNPNYLEIATDRKLPGIQEPPKGQK